MKRWMLVTTAAFLGLVTCAVAEEPGRTPALTPVAAAKPQVEVRVRMMERSVDSPKEGAGNTLGRVLAPAELKPFLKELTDQPGTKTLAEPCLHLEVGQKGSFRSGGEFLIDLPTSEPGQPPLQEKRFFGTALDATVTIPKPGLLSVAFQCEQSERVGTGKTGVPGLNKRAVQTRVELQNGQTMVLQGLASTRNVTTQTRVPLLGDIPIVGDKLFAQTQTELQHFELVVLVTATLIEPPVK
jgi:Flp pilus assembly secretin CpaC